MQDLKRHDMNYEGLFMGRENDQEIDKFQAQYTLFRDLIDSTTVTRHHDPSRDILTAEVHSMWDGGGGGVSGMRLNARIFSLFFI